MLALFFNEQRAGYRGDLIALMEMMTNGDFQPTQLANAISDLHEKGFSEDFTILGEELFWVQQQTCMPTNKFSMVECLRFDDPGEKNKGLLVLGVITTIEYIQGIVMYYFNSTSVLPTAFLRKFSRVT